MRALTNGKSNALQFSAGDILTVARNAGDNWWYGENANGEVGHIYKADVTVMEQDSGT